MTTTTIKPLPLLKIKHDVPNISKEELVNALNAIGEAKKLAKLYNVSRPTLWKSMKFHGIKQVKRYE